MNTNSRGTVTGPFALERLMHAERFAAAIFGRRYAVGDRAHAVVEQRRVDEPRPDVERVDQVAREPAEAPGFVGVHDEIVIAVQEAVIEIDDAAHEGRRKNADAAIIEEIDPGRRAVALEHRVIAEMRVAVNDAEAAERKPPGGEHGGGEHVAHRERRRSCARACGVPSSQSSVSRRPVESSGQARGTRTMSMPSSIVR